MNFFLCCESFNLLVDLHPEVERTHPPLSLNLNDYDSTHFSVTESSTVSHGSTSLRTDSPLHGYPDYLSSLRVEETPRARVLFWLGPSLVSVSLGGFVEWSLVCRRMGVSLLLSLPVWTILLQIFRWLITSRPKDEHCRKYHKCFTWV